MQQPFVVLQVSSQPWSQFKLMQRKRRITQDDKLKIKNSFEFATFLLNTTIYKKCNKM